MPRLRVTTGWSLLALLVAVAGTLWLSVRSDHWDGPDHPVVRTHTAPPKRSYRHLPAHWQAPPRVVGAAGGAVASTPVAPTAAPPSLVPLSMPGLRTRYDAVQGHLDGSLVLSVTVAGDGRVLAVAVRRSSGDPVLDDYAQQLARGWRFAVPPGQSGAFTGDLPMHFGVDRR